MRAYRILVVIYDLTEIRAIKTLYAFISYLYPSVRLLSRYF